MKRYSDLAENPEAIAQLLELEQKTGRGWETIVPGPNPCTFIRPVVKSPVALSGQCKDSPPINPAVNSTVIGAIARSHATRRPRQYSANSGSDSPIT
jgi:hypothetical protein